MLARHRRGVRSLGAHRRYVLGAAPRLAPTGDGAGLRPLEATAADRDEAESAVDCAVRRLLALAAGVR